MSDHQHANVVGDARKRLEEEEAAMQRPWNDIKITGKRTPHLEPFLGCECNWQASHTHVT